MRPLEKCLDKERHGLFAPSGRWKAIRGECEQPQRLIHFAKKDARIQNRRGGEQPVGWFWIAQSNSLDVAVGGGIEFSHAGAIHQVNFPVFTSDHCQVGSHCPV